jgi:hypothetical protein
MPFIHPAFTPGGTYSANNLAPSRTRPPCRTAEHATRCSYTADSDLLASALLKLALPPLLPPAAPRRPAAQHTHTHTPGRSCTAELGETLTPSGACTAKICCFGVRSATSRQRHASPRKKIDNSSSRGLPPLVLQLPAMPIAGTHTRTHTHSTAVRCFPQTISGKELHGLSVRSHNSIHHRGAQQPQT